MPAARARGSFAPRRDLRVRAAWCLIDGSAWFAAVLLATWLRYQFHLPTTFASGTLKMATAAALMHMALGALVGPYRKGHQRGSFGEVFDVTSTTAITTVLAFLWALSITPVLTPRTVPLIAGALALNLMLSLRFLVRAVRHRQVMAEGHRTRVIIFGAGSGGNLLIRNLIQDDAAPYVPVAVLDDDPGKRWINIEGVPVRGGRDDIAKVAAATNATSLIISAPSMEADVVRAIHDQAEAAGLRVMVVPSLSSLVGREPTVGDIRDINLEDLLGRRRITLDQEAIGAQLRGKTVLVTGAGGSIGAELCRQIAHFAPRSLVMLDRDESALQSAQLSIEGHGLLQNDNIVLADIRDQEAMQRVFEIHRPDVVFHAAALKHLPLLESYPLEAWKSNVLGTLNVLRAAAAVRVSTFVNISTDKAADPTCVLGYSKRVAERLTAAVAADEGVRYLSVRFGNVLGSRGSVIPAFTEQIRNGGPVTVTHPDVERYFMLIPEACQLVMQAAVIGKAGEVMVLDMGQPVKIAQIAKTLIDLSGRDDVEVIYTGLRPGEKMSEDLFNRSDDAAVTAHPLVSSVNVPALDGHVVDRMLLTHESASAWMRASAMDTSMQGPAGVPSQPIPGQVDSRAGEVSSR